MSSEAEQSDFFSCFYSVHIFLSESSETLSPVLMGGESGYPFLSGIHRECSNPYCKFATYSLYLCWQCSIWLLVPSILFIFLSWSILNLQVSFCTKVNLYIYVIDHIYWFAYVEPILDLWDETNWLWCFWFFCLFVFILRLKALCVRVVCLHVCICIVCVWHLWRTDLGIRPFGTRVRQLSAAMCVLGSKSLSSAGKCS